MESLDYLEWLDRRPEKDQPLLIGAITYRVVAALVAEGGPGTDVLDGIHKYVFSLTSEAPLAW